MCTSYYIMMLHMEGSRLEMDWTGSCSVFITPAQTQQQHCCFYKHFAGCRAVTIDHRVCAGFLHQIMRYVVQVATAKEVFLFDLLRLNGLPELDAVLGTLYASAAIMKLGMGPSDDLRKLARARS